MEKTYDPRQIEQKWYQAWEKNQYFAPQGEGDAYCIMIPPPNVTGTLHMGHGFQYSLMDTLIRFHRMEQRRTLWQTGTDHAGIATQMVVERQLAAKNTSRHELGREQFVEQVWDWKKISGDQITQQSRRMGISVDWTRERFTMDEGLSHAVREVFIRLFDEGLIYRGKRLVNWDPKLLTAISDLEVISEEEQGNMWHIHYPLANGTQGLIVATTRPETLLGDAAVAVHPDDERYQHLIGQHLKLPLTDRTIPVIADAHVDKEFGTGCVKVTPAHDFNDYAMGKRHDLPLINIMTLDGKINEDAPKAYQGLDRFDARKKIIADLGELLIKTEPHTLKIPRGDRSGVVIEPLLTDQWFIKMESLAKPAIEAVQAGKIEFVPENWTKTYYQWLENIEDWCISRQLWWGHRIPAWYDEEHNIYVGQDETDVRKKYKLSADFKLTQDHDVLDTWFSSALWPFSTLGWPEKTPELAAFYPTQVLVTGFDIIFFWVARMIMFGLKFTGEVPFKQVYITGLIRDHEGQKMSKSKGNVLDPIDLIDGIDLESLVQKRTTALMQPGLAQKIEQATRKQFPKGIAGYGTDALRFTYCALASTGRDIRFDLGRLEGYRNFCNKIWNATRFVLMNTEEHNLKDNVHNFKQSVYDRWISLKLQEAIKTVRDHLTHYRFDLASQALYEFIWNEYCDWYLEFAKTVLNDAEVKKDLKQGTRYTLVNILEQILRLLHPFMPFITEEIWQRVAPLIGIEGSTIMLQAYPKGAEKANSSEDFSLYEIDSWLKPAVLEIRALRSKMNINPGRLISAFWRTKSLPSSGALEERHVKALSMLVRLESLERLPETADTKEFATVMAGDLEFFIPLAGLIDVAAERQRLQKEIERVTQEKEKSEAKLANPQFTKAPEAVVLKEKERLVEWSGLLTRLLEQNDQLQS